MKNLIIMLMSTLLITSCSMFSKSSQKNSNDLKKNYSSIEKQTEMFSKTLDSDLNKRLSTYKELNNKYDNTVKKRAPQADITLSKMQKISNKVKAENQVAAKLNSDIQKITKEKTEISSSDPEWEEYKKIEKQANELNSRINNLRTQYQGLASKYMGYLNQAKVVMVKADNFKKDFFKITKKLKKDAEKLQKNIKIILSPKSLQVKNLSIEKIQQVAKIKFLFESLVKERKIAAKIISKLENSLKGKDVVYFIQDRDNLIDDIKRVYAKVNKISLEVDKLAKSLK